MAISTVSYTKTPQAKTDSFGLNEGSLENGASVLLDVMANDLGGNGKSLYSVDDGNESLKDLLVKDANLATDWELTSGGNLIRIANGKVEYKLTQDINALNAREQLHDSFVYAIEMGKGTLSYTTVNIVIQGENDAATMAGDQDGTVTEDEVLTATGTLTVTDVDHGEAGTRVDSGSTENGSYTVDEHGNWSFTVNNSAIQHLGADDSLTETFTVTSFDGTAEKTVTITLQGSNDLASISGDETGALEEDSSTLTASGILTVSDLDDEEAFAVAAEGATKHGAYTVDADGNWSFTADNEALQHLRGGVSIVETFVVTSLDGTAEKTVSITLTGVNDAATIEGGTTGAVAEDGQLTASGTLTVSDLDDDESGFQSVAAQDLAGLYGSFSFDSDTGAWSYTLDNTKAQALTSSQGATETLTVHSIDGTAQTLTVTITGADEAIPPQGTGTTPPPDPITKHGINYGLNFVNGVYVIQGKQAGDSLANDLFQLNGQIDYKGTFHYEDYDGDGKMDAYIDLSAKDGKDTVDAVIVLIGVSNFSAAMLLHAD